MTGNKNYELTNHLGNVLTVVSDIKIPVNAGDGTISHYTADIKSAQDYYPFGMIMPGRNFNTNTYRFGFNGQEKDDEITGVKGANLDFGAREYDSRIGRWWAVDKEAAKGPGFSPYCFAMNNPILMKDPDGNWPLYIHYQITQAALLKVGYSKQVSAEIAHYSAVYADNPNPNHTSTGAAIMKFNQEQGLKYGIPRSELDYKKDVNYSATNNSQSDGDISAASIHATRTWWENITPEQAIDRALNGGEFKDREGNTVVIEGANNVLKRLSGIAEQDLTDQDKKDLGVAFHTIQDVSAHKGKRFVDKNKQKAAEIDNKNDHSILYDLLGSPNKAKKETEKKAEELTQ